MVRSRGRGRVLNMSKHFRAPRMIINSDILIDYEKKTVSFTNQESLFPKDKRTILKILALYLFTGIFGGHIFSTISKSYSLSTFLIGFFIMFLLVLAITSALILYPFIIPSRFLQSRFNRQFKKVWAIHEIINPHIIRLTTFGRVQVEYYGECADKVRTLEFKNNKKLHTMDLNIIFAEQCSGKVIIKECSRKFF